MPRESLDYPTAITAGGREWALTWEYRSGCMHLRKDCPTAAIVQIAVGRDPVTMTMGAEVTYGTCLWKLEDEHNPRTVIRIRVMPL